MRAGRRTLCASSERYRRRRRRASNWWWVSTPSAQGADTRPLVPCVWLVVFCPSLCPQTQSLRNLGLDITRADINTSASPKQPGVNRFFVTDAQTSDKIVLSERLEEIRATIIHNMLTYHPESRESLAAGRPFNGAGEKQLGSRAKPPVETRIDIKADPSGARSAIPRRHQEGED